MASAMRERRLSMAEAGINGRSSGGVVVAAAGGGMGVRSPEVTPGTTMRRPGEGVRDAIGVARGVCDGRGCGVVVGGRKPPGPSARTEVALRATRVAIAAATA